MSISDIFGKQTLFFIFLLWSRDSLNYIFWTPLTISFPLNYSFLHIGGNVLTVHDPPSSRKRLHFHHETTSQTQLTQTIWTDINILSWSNKCKFRHRWQSQLVLVQTQQLIFWCGEQILWHILDALGFCSSCRYCHPGTGTQFSKARFRRGGSLSERIWIWERLVYDGKPFLMQLWWSVIECVYSCDCTHGCQGASIVIKDSSHTLITHSLIYTPNLDWHCRSLCCTICGCCTCAGFIAGIIIMVVYLSAEPSDRGRA